MKLELFRNKSINGTTIGKLFVDGVFECYTLEDEIRCEKIRGITAIPAGVYSIIINMSNRFKRLLPLLQKVPEFEGVRIHPGNKHQDTEGCILVGKTVRPDQQWIFESRGAFATLFAKMQAAKTPINITIHNPE